MGRVNESIGLSAEQKHIMGLLQQESDKFKSEHIQPYNVRMFLAKKMARDYCREHNYDGDEKIWANAYVQAQAIINNRYPSYNIDGKVVYLGVCVPVMFYRHLPTYEAKQSFLKQICSSAISRDAVLVE